LLKNEIDNENKIKLIDGIQSDLKNAYLNEKINKEHYDLLKEMILEYKNKDNTNNK
jgi:hypothetical protein